MIAILETIVRYLAVWLDGLVFNLIPTVYNLLIDIAETTVFSNVIIDVFAKRIYGLLGIFMLFKVSFSILTYIVNPDDFADKNKGAAKLVKNILVTLLLLVATPFIFTQAMQIQTLVLKDNVLGKLILGSSDTSYTSQVNTSDPGKLMAYETFRAFYYPDAKISASCEGYNNGDAGKAEECIKGFGVKSGKEEKFIETLEYGAKSKSIGIYLNTDMASYKTDAGFVMEYTPIISTVCGIFILLILIGFCFDVAVRSIKLGLLRMIAPLPIISRIDPKKGTETFNKWLKLCLSTYLDLFTRLISIYFAVFAITQIVSLNGKPVSAVTGEPMQVSPFVIIFIIMGALLFAKQLPKLIEDLLGIKLAGTFQLNPMKKLNEVPLVGATGAALGGAFAGYRAGSQVGAKGFGALSGALSGAKSTPLSGAKSGEGTFFKGANSAYKSLMGKDFVTMGMANFMPEAMKKKSVDEVGAPLKNAYAALSKFNTDLNQASATTNRENDALAAAGINSNSDAVKNYARQYADWNKEKSSLKRQLTNTDLSADQRTNLNNKLSDIENNMKDSSKMDITLRNNSTEVMKYAAATADEERLRGVISGIDKDIKDLSKEKSSREQFYRYDPSPEENVRANVSKYNDPDYISNMDR